MSSVPFSCLRLIPRKLSIGNPNLDEWYLKYTPMNYEQLIALQEASETTMLDEMDVIKQILSVLNGFETPLFTWNEEKCMFNIEPRYCLWNLNSKCLNNYLQKYAIVGTKFRQMQLFCEKEFNRGETFRAFQSVLNQILEELFGKTVKLYENIRKRKLNDPELKISLLRFRSCVDSEASGNLPLLIEMLHSIYSDINCDILSDSQSDINTDRIHRFYCHRILWAIYMRTRIENHSVKSLVFTMFEHCLRPMMVQIGDKLIHLNDISLASSFEFPFRSEFSSDQSVYLKYLSSNSEDLHLFWKNLLHFDDSEFTDIPAISGNVFKIVSEAIKASYILRKNGVQAQSLNSLVSNILMQEFKKSVFSNLERYMSLGQILDIHTQCTVEKIRISLPFESDFKVPQPELRRFKSYVWPKETFIPMCSILDQSLEQSLQTVCRPIVQEFVFHIKARYFELINFYKDFFLFQKAHHLIQYKHFIFPLISDVDFKENFFIIQNSIKHIHLSDTSLFREIFDFFKPHFLKINFDDRSDYRLQMSLFVNLFFVPDFDYSSSNSSNSFENNREKEFYNFWPLSIMFQNRTNDVCNYLFQFILKLQFIEHQLGTKVLLSANFRKNESYSRERLIFRWNLLKSVRQVLYDLDIVVKDLFRMFNKSFKEIDTVENLMTLHQKFIDRLESILKTYRDNTFIQNMLLASFKFCFKNTVDLNDSSKKDIKPIIKNCIRNVSYIDEDMKFTKLQL